MPIFCLKIGIPKQLQKKCKMKISVKAFLLFLSIGLMPMVVEAQFSFGLFGGVSNYQGDLSKDITNIEETHVAFGGGLGYKISPNFEIKGQLLLTTLSGDDANYPDDIARSKRLFRFESSVTELSVILDYNIFGSATRSNTGLFTPKFSPVAYIGLGVAKISNVAECLSEDCINGVVLSPFPEKDAKSSLVTVPFGIGFKYDVSPLLSVGLRGGYRYSFSDYLDGVSKAANEDANDWYFVLGAHVGFYIQPKRDGMF